MKKILLAGAALAALATSAVAADLPSRKAPVYAPVATPVFAWSGSYIGLNVGYDWFTGNASKLHGASIALRGGHDWQLSNGLVLGVLADVGYSFAKHTVSGAGWSDSIKARWDASLDARVGYAVSPSMLAYALGGFTYRNFENKGYYTVPPIVTYKNSIDAYGFNVGAGVEYKVAQNWSVYGEYRFTRVFLDTRANPGVNSHGVKLGVNYRFGSPAPVVAKY